MLNHECNNINENEWWPENAQQFLPSPPQPISQPETSKTRPCNIILRLKEIDEKNINFLLLNSQDQHLIMKSFIDKNCHLMEKATYFEPLKTESTTKKHLFKPIEVIIFNRHQIGQFEMKTLAQLLKKEIIFTNNSIQNSVNLINDEQSKLMQTITCKQCSNKTFIPIKPFHNYHWHPHFCQNCMKKARSLKPEHVCQKHNLTCEEGICTACYKTCSACQSSTPVEGNEPKALIHHCLICLDKFLTYPKMMNHIYLCQSCFTTIENHHQNSILNPMVKSILHQSYL